MAEETAELSETVELATLDKEMAEEKAETLQLELDAAKEKIEELQGCALIRIWMRERLLLYTNTGCLIWWRTWVLGWVGID